MKSNSEVKFLKYKQQQHKKQKTTEIISFEYHPAGLSSKQFPVPNFRGSSLCTLSITK